MDYTIPVYSLQKVAALDDPHQKVFFTDATLSSVQAPLHVPYRSDYFGVSICTQGTATLHADLVPYNISSQCVVAMSPLVIKQWTSRPPEFRTLTVFFKADFFLSVIKVADFLDQFIFFQHNENHALQLNNEQAELVTGIIRNIKTLLQSLKAYKMEIVAHQVCVLLYHLQDFFQTDNFTKKVHQTRSQQLTTDFKNLASQYFKQEHSVKYYANALFVTTKHLSEIVKAETGRTAGEWIDELLILEAKVLLSKPQITINEISHLLHFTDQSAFGKFFKNLTDLSPKAYKKGL
jgi:AraC family transcriptional regulator, transcriptional activator of pobA